MLQFLRKQREKVGRFYTVGRTDEKWQPIFRKRLKIQERTVQDFTLDRQLVFGAKPDLFWKPKKFGLSNRTRQ